jgi:hypothetical protein
MALSPAPTVIVEANLVRCQETFVGRNFYFLKNIHILSEISTRKNKIDSVLAYSPLT